MSDVFGSLSSDSLPSGYGEEDSSNALMPTLTQSPPAVNIPGAWATGASSTVPIQQGVPDGLSFDMYEEGEEKKAQDAAKANPQKPAPLSPDIERSLFFKALKAHTPSPPPARTNPRIEMTPGTARDPKAAVFVDSGGYMWDMNPDASVTGLNKETTNRRFLQGSTVAVEVFRQARERNAKLPVPGPYAPQPWTPNEGAFATSWTTTTQAPISTGTASVADSKPKKKKGKKGKKGVKGKKPASGRPSATGRSTAVQVAEVLAPVAAAAVGIDMPASSTGLEDTSMEEYDESYEEEEEEGMGIGAKIALTLGFFALCGAGYYYYQKRQAANASS